MYADRNTRSPGIKPGSLAAAVAINGGVLAALLLAPPMKVFGPSKDPFELINVPSPPPPPDPAPPVLRDSPPKAQPIAPKLLVDVLQPPTKVDIDTRPFTAESVGRDDGVVQGTGTGVIIDPPVTPPLIVDPEIDPRYLRDFQPDYPPAEQRAERSGTVTVRVLIGTDGRVRAIEPVTATSDDFFAATRRTALARWRFRPATRDGVPFEKWRTMRVTFRFVDS